MDKAVNENTVPQCVFKPSKEMMTRIIETFMKKPNDETSDEFLFRFGLLNNPD